MSIFNISSTITITCHKWHTPHLAHEVSELGYSITDTFVTGLKIQGTLKDCIRLNLNLNCASQVLFSIGKFEAKNATEVYNYVRQIAWDQYLDKEEYFTVTSNVRHPTISNGMFANVKVKDAIVDFFRDKYEIRPSSGSEFNGAVFHLFWNEYEAEIFIDTTGESLARHGYRKIPGRAPMLEALASATVIASGWDKKSNFVNPMCGSGTLAIEAALMATGAKPGLHRAQYAFMFLLDFEEQEYLTLLKEMEDNILKTLDFKIIASDHDELAIENAKKNAEAAGVADLIEFEVCDFSETTIPENGGVVFMNPEYGERMGEIEELEITYKAIGDFLKNKCRGYNGYVFTGNLDLAKKIGLKAKRRIEFFTGKIECRLLEYELYQGTRDPRKMDK